VRQPLQRSAAIALILACVVACSEPEPVGETHEPAATSTATAEAGTPVRGDWLVLWALSDAESLNPLTSNDAGASAVLANVMTSLTTLNPENLEQVPVLATELPTVSPDHLSYTFHIRRDAKFSDGKPITIEDVLFSFKAIKHPEVDAPFLRNYFQSAVDAEIVDEDTIVFRCQEPYFRNDRVLGSISILPRHFYDPDGLLEDVTVADFGNWEKLAAGKKTKALEFSNRFNRDFHRKVLGAGAYALTDPGRDLVTGERATLRHWPEFWAPADPLRGDGWVDRIVYRVINNQDAALVSLKARTLDAMNLSPTQHLKQTNTPGFEDGFRKEIYFTPSYLYIGWNQKKPGLAEKQVRQALSQLVDRDRIISRVMLGLAEKIDSPVYRFSPEYNEKITGWGFDPAAAKRVLEEAGWIDRDGDGVREKTIDGKPTPLRFEIISNAGNAIRKNVGLIAVDELRRAGIDASFRELDWSIMLQRLDRREYDAVIIGWQFSPADPDLYQIWHSSQIVQGGSNHVNFVNEEADRILVEYRREFDKEKRIPMYDRLQEIIHEEAPYTFLFMQKAVMAYDHRFHGVRWFPTGGTNYGEWWVPLADQRYGN
jgi:peptide/nickel transport system substrate-binding protein